jgi:uroporphyrinogen decarboxylase
MTKYDILCILYSMSYTRKERVSRILNHLPVDRLPTQITYTGTMGKKCAAHFNVAEEELPEFFNNHLVRVDLSYEKRYNQDRSVVYDLWGAGFDAREEGYRIADSPLAGNDSLESIQWPDPTEESLFSRARRIIEEDTHTHFILPNLGFALFERAWSLRGMEQFLMDLALQPEWAEELLERITVIQVELARGFVEAGVDGGYFGDDLGAQRGLLFSPDTWRSLFKPRLKRMFDVFTRAGLPVVMHSDGDISPIIPDLIEIGLTALNPCQPEVLDHHWLKNEYGDQLAFYGGVSTQKTLPYGTREEVFTAGKQCIEQLASDGTGLIYGPSHRLMSDIPLENIESLLDSFCNTTP